MLTRLVCVVKTEQWSDSFDDLQRCTSLGQGVEGPRQVVAMLQSIFFRFLETVALCARGRKARSHTRPDAE